MSGLSPYSGSGEGECQGDVGGHLWRSRAPGVLCSWIRQAGVLLVRSPWRRRRPAGGAFVPRLRHDELRSFPAVKVLDCWGLCSGVLAATNGWLCCMYSSFSWASVMFALTCGNISACLRLVKPAPAVWLRLFFLSSACWSRGTEDGNFPSHDSSVLSGLLCVPLLLAALHHCQSTQGLREG